MRKFCWTSLYSKTLSLAPENFFAGTPVAAEAILARLRDMGTPQTASDVREEREILLALADLYVLRTPFLRHPVSAFPIQPPKTPVA